MEIYQPDEELDPNGESTGYESPVCSIPGGKRYQLSLCMKLAMTFGWKRIVFSAGATLLLLMIMDLVYVMSGDSITTTMLIVQISLTSALVLGDFFLTWFLQAKRLQNMSTQSVGNTTNLYNDHLTCQVLVPDYQTGMLTKKEQLLFYRDFVSVRESKQVFLIQTVIPDIGMPFMLLILKDERLNDKAREILENVVREINGKD